MRLATGVARMFAGISCEFVNILDFIEATNEVVVSIAGTR